LKPGDTAFDIGAHVGVMSVMISRLVGDYGHVHSFEPTPSTTRVLHQVMKLNRCSNVTVHGLAMSGEIGTAKFFDTGNIASNANSLINQNRMNGSVTVETITLDAFCTQHMLHPRVIKVDVEGAELSVLLGGIHAIAKHRPSMALSLHPPIFDDSQQTLSDIWDLLDGCDMQLHLLEPYAAGGEVGQLLSRDEFTKQVQLFDVEVTPRRPSTGS